VNWEDGRTLIGQLEDLSIRQFIRVLAETEREKGKKARSLSPPRGAPRRIGTGADED
jgi:hypothetical protein